MRGSRRRVNGANGRNGAGGGDLPVLVDGGMPAPDPDFGEPPGLGGFFGVDDMGKGHSNNLSVAEIFMRAHPEDPMLLWPGSYFEDERDLLDHIGLVAEAMMGLGNVDTLTLMYLKLAGRLAIKGYSREQALRALAGERQGMVARTAAGLKNMFTFGKDKDIEPPKSLPSG